MKSKQKITEEYRDYKPQRITDQLALNEIEGQKFISIFVDIFILNN